MIEEYSSKSWRDFSQRYKDTYGWYLGSSGKKTLVKLTEVGEVILRFVDDAGVPYSANADKGNCFEFIPLEKSLYIYKDSLVLCQRVPARQWRRGIHQHNTSITQVNGGWGGIDISFDVLVNVLSPTNHKDGLRRFLAGASTDVALNAMFGVSKSNVYVYNRVIGSYNKGTITLKDGLFKQEFSDVIRDLNLDWKLA